ncbi:MAG: PAS domain-containing protein, partial [Burkholderiales bacterium]|nr:PAS domain-containing protein [Burkholderiales bacterium]
MSAQAVSKPDPAQGGRAPNAGHRMFVPTDKPAPVLSWCEQLATGLPEVDAEHRRLIDLINDVGGLHARHATTEELRAALVELRRYSAYHFQNEADLMQKYPVDAKNRRTHLAAHGGFIERLDSAEALATTDTAAAVAHLLTFLAKWLVGHVTGIDARMAREIAALKSGVPAGDRVQEDSPANQALLNTVTELYANMGARTFELLQANHRLQTEIERRQRADEALRLAAIVFDTVDEGVIVTGTDNKIIAVNPSFCRITGYTEDEVIGENPSMLAGGVHPPGFYRELWGALTTNGRWQGEICNRRKNGELFVEWLSIKRL